MMKKQISKRILSLGLCLALVLTGLLATLPAASAEAAPGVFVQMPNHYLKWSGAGAHFYLDINDDGTFSGHTYSPIGGEIDDAFSGKLVDPQKLNSYSYSFEVGELTGHPWPMKKGATVYLYVGGITNASDLPKDMPKGNQEGWTGRERLLPYWTFYVPATEAVYVASEIVNDDLALPPVTQPGSGSSALEATQQDFANLEHYLGTTHFAFRGSYNYAENDLETILERIWMADYQIYFPTAQMNDPWKNKNKDPQKRFSDTFYYKLDADKCDWIISNIYNAVPDHAYSDRFTYYDGGYYYINVAGAGDAGYTAKIASKEPLADGKYYISYKVYMMFDNSLVGNRYVVADLKEIDGGRYWTFYEMSTSSINTAKYKIASKPVAYASTQAVYIDGDPVTFQMYALMDANGNPTNYIKVRDLAYTLNGTPAQFAVGYYGGCVQLVQGWSYEPNGSEMKTPYSGDQYYTAEGVNTQVNEAPVTLDHIYIADANGGGYTYYKLRDLGMALGFNVRWDTQRGVCIDTDRPYTG